MYDHEAREWSDTHADLPVDSTDGSPILLVPRRLVRQLPGINYEDFLKTEFNAYLSARRATVQREVAKQNKSGPQLKPDVITATRSDIALAERYVHTRERRADDARPDTNYIDEDSCRQAHVLTEKLRTIAPRREEAKAYQLLVLEVLNYLFNPELTDGELEVRTFEGTERRDIVFTTESDESFWTYVKSNHDGIFVMFEAKNPREWDMAAQPSEAVQRKMFSVWNDSSPNRKVILVLTDEHLADLLQLRCRNQSPTKWMQRHYRDFRTAVQ